MYGYGQRRGMFTLKHSGSLIVTRTENGFVEQQNPSTNQFTGSNTG